MNETRRFALIQLDPEPCDPMQLAKALAAIRGTPVQDQVLVARGAWGIVADDLSEMEAKSLGQALRSAGVRCAAGPVNALARIPAAEMLSTFGDMPAARPTLMAVAGLSVRTEKTTSVKKGPSGAQKAASTAIMMTTGIPIKIGGRKGKVEKTRSEESLAFFVDLYYENPARRLRIDASSFDFSCLDQRMLYQAQGNLKLLMGDLVQASPESWLNHGARVLLEGRPIRTMGYRSLDDLEREARWLLTLRSLGK